MSGESPQPTWIENLVHEPTQVHETGVDLTISAIYEVASPGAIDFGGGELADADLEPVEPVRRDPDDDYGWWNLEAGQYLVQFNEFLADPAESLLLQPRNELLARGGSHPSLRVTSHLPLVPLSVPQAGLELKENARISTVSPWQQSEQDVIDSR